MLTDLIPPWKDTVWQPGLKRKIQQFIAYRRPASLTETSLGWWWNPGRIFTTKQTEVEKLISYNVDFKPILIKWDKKGHSILIKEEIHQK
jgi:hypothetical protein